LKLAGWKAAEVKKTSETNQSTGTSYLLKRHGLPCLITSPVRFIQIHASNSKLEHVLFMLCFTDPAKLQWYIQLYLTNTMHIRMYGCTPRRTSSFEHVLFKQSL